tara:strand:- start:2871 stop:3554 length:684 start_codon:yes stop_codon:yes gene_type:complete
VNAQDFKENYPQFQAPQQGQGLFISFEGIEGSGKSTQIQILSQYLNEQGYQTSVLREPGGTIFGEKLRDAILSSKESLSALAEAHLFASARAQLLHEKIIPKLKDPKNVILLDRYIDSSFAYQGVARGLGINEILRIHHTYPLCLFPHTTFYLAISPEDSLKRQEARGQERDYFESEKFQFTQKLFEGFEKCSEVFNQRIVKIDGNQTREDVSKQIKKTLSNRNLTP